jgi:hypothetical protein
VLDDVIAEIIYKSGSSANELSHKDVHRYIVAAVATDGSADVSNTKNTLAIPE